MIRMRVLVHEFVTGGGLAGREIPASWAAEGHAMRRALAGDFAAIEGASVVMTLDPRFPDEPGPWEVVRIGPGEEPSGFARLAAGCDYTLCVAPETGGILEGRARMIEAAGGRSLGCSADAVSLCGDKRRFGEHLRARGIPSPFSVRVVPRDGLPRHHPDTWVL
jgi:predicted ATP-grasp superfamily ATP-dependent carboligase